MAKRVTAVHQAQDFQVLVAQELGDRQGHVGGLASLEGRLVGGGHHDDGALEAFLAQGFFDELPDLTAPFADQPHHDSVAVGLFGQHGEQHRLANARAREDAQALATAAGGEDVHGPDTQIQPRTDAAARVRRRRGGPQRIGSRTLRQGAESVDGLAEGVDDPAEPGACRTHGRTHGVDADFRPRRHALDRAEGHQQGAGFSEADHLGLEGSIGASLDLGARAHRQAGQPAAGFDQQTVHRRDAARNGQRIDTLDGRDETTQDGGTPGELFSP
jgi:hypothetical protein